ncbi:hypothetical protein BWD10_11950 [Neisseria zoodegmatis]|uniref:RHS protein conserved region domain-containing protein n=1 Tax=Neisseria zoodegmatis TaxID=326523 RepID=A0ABX3WCK0_9NEIS|nr:hypothetical protein BWD10_11950 [Neisseria zoodegmatis]
MVTEYRYDILGNRTQTILPTGETLNYLYYGSGHLHHINLDGDTITDIERDDLHRPVSRSAGKLHTRLISDPLGRLKEQLVQLEATNGKATEPKGLIKRRYHYDTNGNLVQTEDQHHGNKDYAYDPLGRITRAGDERFAFDPAHNISGDGVKVAGNRLTDYNGIRYVYDPLGNLSERHNDATGESQYYRYDADNQLTEARIEQEGRPSEHWHYRYDALGRRVSKQNAHNQTETRFLWEGSRLLQEYGDKATYTYVYTEQGSYEPLAQIVQTANRDGSKTDRQILYYHNDQIGIPRELTDAEGNIVWRGEYSGWGKLNNAEGANLKEDVHQPFRLQNQYADKETGLHYNFFRYYDPHCGRFTQQDPIKLAGGYALYNYSLQPMKFIDPLGWVEWKGTAYSVSAGVLTGTRFELKTECIKGKRGHATVYASGGSYGVGGIVGSNGSDVTFEDKLDHIDPNVFNGLYSEGSGNITFIKGIGLGSTKLGQAESKGLLTIYDRGYSVGLAANGGKSTVTSSYIESCQEKPKVNCGKCQYPNNYPIENLPPAPNVSINEMIRMVPYY